MKLSPTNMLMAASLGFLPGVDMQCGTDAQKVLCDANVNAPAPALDSIDFLLVDKYTSSTGRIQVWGVVKNKGLARYESDPGQQRIHLYEDGVLVSTYDFEDLAPGDSIGVIYYREWTDATREFPPTYRAEIVYDPDILIDGNPANNDCSFDDNVLTRSGAGANALFD